MAFLEPIARPFGSLLMFLYNLVGNYGLALALFAVVVRVILLPFQMKSKRGMMRQTRLQPKIAELQKKHGANKAKVNEEMAKLYKEEGVNPASGCLWGFLPLPIMFALFLVIRQPITMMLGVAEGLLSAGPPIGEILAQLNTTGWVEGTGNNYYTQIAQAQWISSHWESFRHFAAQGLRNVDFNLGPLNLGAQPEWNFLWTTDWGNRDIWLPGLMLFFIPLVSGGSQFLASGINRKLSPVGSPEGAGGSMQTMMMLMPLMSVWFGFILPAALGFYWTVGTFLQIGQDIWLTKRYTRIIDAEDAVRNEERKRKEAEIEAKRLETERKKAEGIVEINPNTSKRKKKKSNKQEQIEKTAEWEKKDQPADEEYNPSRVGNRRHARGRAYDPDRYGDNSESGVQNSESEDGDDESSEPGIKDSELDSEGQDTSSGSDGVEAEGEDADDDGDGDSDEDDNDDEDEDDGDDEDEEDDGDEDDDDDESSTTRFDTTRFDKDK